MLSARPSRGFTIIELMTAITVMALLIALGVPSMSSYLQSSKLTSAAHTYYAALQAARTEAIRLNTQVAFAALPPGQLPAGVAVATTGPLPVVFNGFGTPVNPGAPANPNQAFRFDFSNITGDACRTPGGGGGPMHCPSVVVSTGGQIAMCDSAVAPNSIGDSRVCP